MKKSTAFRAALLSIAGLAFSLGSASASGPDEFTLQPVGVGSSTIVYTPESNSGGATISTDPTAPEGSGEFEKVNIDDYLVPETKTDSQ